MEKIRKRSKRREVKERRIRTKVEESGLEIGVGIDEPPKRSRGVTRDCRGCKSTSTISNNLYKCLIPSVIL